ncbi:hypothetical protein NQ317_003955 [Molorchus minor]|uniref:Uncharacterized protein n=1 Tax=Molorchus minor TaxID=1323400 RepID=A0ABQ9IUG8_9CUCU|nr:hypothetical protein NQ317_003955 [Molorchus minor]
MTTDIKALISADNETYKKCLENFVINSDKTFVLPELNEGNMRIELWNSLLNAAKTTQDEEFPSPAIREKNSLQKLVTEDWLNLIKKHIGLADKEFLFTSNNLSVSVEAQKKFMQYYI